MEIAAPHECPTGEFGILLELAYDRLFSSLCSRGEDGKVAKGKGG